LRHEIDFGEYSTPEKSLLTEKPGKSFVNMEKNGSVGGFVIQGSGIRYYEKS
jgi:hypothetical protein